METQKHLKQIIMQRGDSKRRPPTWLCITGMACQSSGGPFAFHLSNLRQECMFTDYSMQSETIQQFNSLGSFMAALG